MPLRLKEIIDEVMKQIEESMRSQLDMIQVVLKLIKCSEGLEIAWLQTFPKQQSNGCTKKEKRRC
jgi:hypothetical protein